MLILTGLKEETEQYWKQRAKLRALAAMSLKGIVGQGSMGATPLMRKS